MLLTWFGKNPLRKFRIIIDNPLSANWVPVDPPAFPGVPIFRIIPLKTRTLQHSPIYGWRLKLSPGAPATVIHLVFFGLNENPLPGFLVTQAVYIDSAFYVHPTPGDTFGKRPEVLGTGMGRTTLGRVTPRNWPSCWNRNWSIPTTVRNVSLSVSPAILYVYIYI